MPPMSKVELYAAIRRDARAGMSGPGDGAQARCRPADGVKALSSAWPEPRKKLPPRGSRLDSFKPVIDEILRADLDAPRKQRHTVKRIFDRLMDEHGMVGRLLPGGARLRRGTQAAGPGGGGPRAGRGVRAADTPSGR